MDKTRNLIQRLMDWFDTDNMYDLGVKLIDHYYKNFYNGTEHEKVSKLYFEHFYMDLVIWLGKNAQYLKQDESALEDTKYFFKKNIIQAKIDTYDMRRNIYNNWLDRYDDGSNEILTYLLKVYKNESEYKEVKKELGLYENVEQLKQKVKDLK